MEVKVRSSCTWPRHVIAILVEAIRLAVFAQQMQSLEKCSVTCLSPKRSYNHARLASRPSNEPSLLEAEAWAQGRRRGVFIISGALRDTKEAWRVVVVHVQEVVTGRRWLMEAAGI